jgi:carotenoid cleavage dioxygenase
MLEASHHAAPTNPYLEGNWTPTKEEAEIPDLPIQGSIPGDLAGVYMRNGPNPKFDPIEYVYPFDGDGMVHAVYFEKGKARYRNRWVRTAGLAAEERAGKAIYGSSVKPKPPDPSLLQEGDPPLFKDDANINIINHGGHYLALYEGDTAYELTRELDTVGPYDFHGAAQAVCAHPRIDQVTGELHFFNYDIQPPYLTYYVADRSGKVTVDQPIDLPAPTMIHDFVITESRVVFFDCPVVFDFEAMGRGESPLQWKPELGTRLVMLDRAKPDAKPTVVETDAFWVFHFVNAYDEGADEVVVDFVRHEFLSFGAKAGNPHPSMYRMVIDARSGKAKLDPVDDPDRVTEFPRTNDALTGRKHRYGYCAAHELKHPKPGHWDAAAQYDFETGTAKIQTFGRGRYPGEPVFVPRPGATDEDDGYVVSFVYSAERGKSDLVMADARDFDGEPVVTIQLPVRVPFGLHGNWMPIESG